ncbi:MAG: preprotein translocase subunit SecA [Gammaproteobacteria bacterium]|nr:preprotein translocase subunit SecA [Gammaproteobacteria bacterium]
MISNLFKKVFGSRNDRVIKELSKEVGAISALESDCESLSDDDLRAKTETFRQRLQAGETLEDLLPEAFAVVREGGKRALGMRHFDEQLIGAMVLNEGKIAEMRTGEGKTLVATLAVYLNALSGQGVHVVTVNDYLAHRDSDWMGKLYHFLGLSYGVIVANMDQEKRRAAYEADITYGTNNEFGFDYLRDNMAFSEEEKVQRELNFAIIDEVDSILIDEARTPLIISGPANDNAELYRRINLLVPHLTLQEEEDGPGDYSIEEKSKQVYLTEAGHENVERLLAEEGLLQEGESLYDAAHIGLMHHINAAVRAHVIYQKDVDYIVKEGQIVIVDEFTGRTMEGRRWSEGLHQAVEAKEDVVVQNENQTLAAITFQNYFRLYGKLSGMTGTADTEAFEFQQIYGLEVVVLPTHLPMQRKDLPDLVFLTTEEKYQAIIEDIEECVKRQQPVLVGTTSIETSEYLSSLLKKKALKHEVLNAKQHEREAGIVANAGCSGAVTIATNMAGRGTDIVLGGSLVVELKEKGEISSTEKEQLETAWQQRHDVVLKSGGLHIIGTERHESRRIDNQLRGRSGRQGDEGSTRFYLSLEDNLMRIFASDRVANLMQKLGMEEGEAIEHPWVTKAIENAQRKVEAHNFDMRKNLLEYDDVANDQRKVVYEQRNSLLASEDTSEIIKAIRVDVVNGIIDQYIPPGSLDEQWDVEGCRDALEHELGEKMDLPMWLAEDEELDEEALRARIVQTLEERYQAKEDMAGAESLRRFEKAVMLQVLDTQWKDHLAAMDYLRQSIGLRGYAQKNPKQEYKRESFEMFTQLLDQVKQEVVVVLSRVEVQNDDAERLEESQRQTAPMNYQHAEANSAIQSGVAEEDVQADDEEIHTPYVREQPKLGRNEPCWCGSGKKFKQCHGKLK